VSGGLLLVCSSGGHLLQLHELRAAWEPFPRAWVTFDKSDARSLLRDERRRRSTWLSRDRTWMTAHDLYHGWFYHNGALRLAATLGWGTQMLREDVRRSGLAETSRTLEDLWLNVRQQALYAPYAASPGLNQPGIPAYLKDWISHRHWDDYWRTFDLSARLPQLPALHLSGWYDLYLKGSIDTFLALQTAGCPNQYLIAGPWIHIPLGTRAGDADLGEAAALDTNLILCAGSIIG